MIIKLKNTYFNYLKNRLSEKQPDYNLKFQVRHKKHFVFIEVEEDVADEIRDWAGEELQKKGFDSNYSLTSEGIILQELIDAFFEK